MPKNDKKSTDELSKIWLTVRQKLEDVTKEHQRIKSEIADLDAFLKEVVNQLIIILQDVHESLDMLEEKCDHKYT